MTAAQKPVRGSTALRLREGRAPVRERLMAMLFLTALLHAIVILGVSFGSGGHGALADTPQLDVLLVTNEVPEASSNANAAYLAQRTQLGAGNTDTHEPPGSPATRGALASATAPVQGLDQRNGTAAKARSSERVLVTTAVTPDIRYFSEQSDPSQAAALPQFIGDTEGAPRSGRGDAVELLLRGKANDEHWISPDTRASKLAPYLADWKRKVERVGTLNFPSVARREGLSGSPVVEVEIGDDGRLRQAHVQRTSGYGELDQAALTILKLASPFNPFPAEVAAEYSRLRFAYQWEFVAGALQSGTAGPAAEPGAATAPAAATEPVSSSNNTSRQPVMPSSDRAPGP